MLRADEDPYGHPAPGATSPTAATYFAAPGTPRADDLRRLADVLNAGSKVAVLAGAGALHARDQLLELAEIASGRRS